MPSRTIRSGKRIAQEFSPTTLKMPTYSGQHGRYFWHADPDGWLAEFVSAFPEIVHDKYVAVTAFDSGPLRIDANDQQAGWHAVGRIAYSPKVMEASALPCDQYDEWYVFGEPARLENVEVFVNYAEFSPLDPPEQFKEAGSTIWGMAAGDFISARRDEQRRFWSQLERNSPEFYIADGDWFVFATQHKLLYDRIRDWICTKRDA